MRRRLAAVALGVALAGCASTGWPFDSANMLLARADRLADRQEYEAALRAYDEFLSRYPADPAAPRALKSRDAVASIAAAGSELARLRGELAARDAALAARDAALAARDAELAAREAELAARDAELAKLRQLTERLRADLEKLKEVDLNLERKKR